MIILIPLPLFFSSVVFGVRGLSAWVVIGIIWTFFASFTVVLLPLYESREALGQVSKGLLKVRIAPLAVLCQHVIALFNRCVLLFIFI